MIEIVLDSVALTSKLGLLVLTDVEFSLLKLPNWRFVVKIDMYNSYRKSFISTVLSNRSHHGFSEGTANIHGHSVILESEACDTVRSHATS